MEKLKDLNTYQKCIIVVMSIMALCFAVIYFFTISRVGYRYMDAILVPTQENGNTIYSGIIHGEKTQFIVSNDKSVILQYGDKTYGPYTMKEDPSAIPEEEVLKEQMIGLEIYDGKELMFRGGILDVGDTYWLYDEDGMLDDLGVVYVTGNGVERDEQGNVIDKMKPSASTIYELMIGPELTHKGQAFAWFGAVFLCILNTLYILYADVLFRVRLLFWIQNVEDAEPSDWEIAGRYMGWTLLPVIALIIFIIGLQ